jgi:uncharacterized protein (TIGR00369 family)
MPETTASGLGPNAWGKAAGIRIVEATPERVRAEVEIGPQHHQPYGIAHGGVYCSIVEDVASHGAGRAAAARGQRGVVGVANATDFLRSHGAGLLDAVGTPLHVGRSQQLWVVEIRRRADGVLVARGQVRFQVLDRLPSEPRAAGGVA